MTTIVTFLTLAVIIWQISFLKRIIANKADLAGLIIGRFVFRDRMELLQSVDESSISENDQWLKSLALLIGRNVSIADIKEQMHSRFEQKQNAIRTYANLAPAIGLLFTFVGLICVLIGIGKNDPNITNHLSGLWPVVCGSASGIFVYAFGNKALKTTGDAVNNAVDGYLAEFLILDGKESISKIGGMEDVYQKLLAPMTQLMDVFKKLKTNFSKFDTSYEKHIEKFGEQIEEQNRNLTTHLSGLSSGLSMYFEKSNQNLEVLNLTIGQMNSFKDNIDYLQNQVASSLKQLELFVGSTDEVKAIVNSLGEAIGTMLKGSESIEKISGEISNQNGNLKILTQAFDGYTIKVQENITQSAGFSQSVENLNKNIAMPLSKIGENIENFPTKDLAGLTREIAEIKSAILSLNRKQEVDVKFDYNRLAEILHQKPTTENKEKTKLVKFKQFIYHVAVISTSIAAATGIFLVIDWAVK